MQFSIAISGSNPGPPRRKNPVSTVTVVVFLCVNIKEIMMKLNTKKRPTVKTHEGAKVYPKSEVEQLERAVLSCMLWEDTFYESGQSIADRIKELAGRVEPDISVPLAFKARHQYKLRHVPLWLACGIFEGNKHKKPDSFCFSPIVTNIIERPDELTELLAMWWKDGKRPIPNQMKKGLAKAFLKFDEYQFKKWDKANSIKIRDVMFICRPKPETEEQKELFKCIANSTLKAADTWETSLSAGTKKKSDQDKKEVWINKLNSKKLGGLAFLRNLRNMKECGVPDKTIKDYFKVANFSKVLPFRFITAAKYAPSLECELQEAMFNALKDYEKLPGKTVILVDNSYSMYGTKVSSKSELDRSDAAVALAMLVRQVCDESVVYAFSNNTKLIGSSRRGFALRDAIRATECSGTDIRTATKVAEKEGYDRIIIITDEQSHTAISEPLPKTKGYFLNVASYENGVGYGAWTTISGWSEAVIDYILQYEKEFS